MRQPVEIFCCAAEADRYFLGQLSNQLALQQQQGIITLWDESQIPAGAMVDQETQRHLASARIFLLLISPDFLASNHCYNTVMRVALERHGRGEAMAIPVIVRPAIWQDANILKHIQVLPRNGLPISGQRDRDQALWEVAKEIALAVQRLGGPGSQPGSGVRYGEPYSAMASPQTGSGFHSGTFPPGPPPATGYPPVARGRNSSSAPGNVQKKIGIVLLLAALAIVLAGGAAFALYTKSSSNVGSGNTPSATPTQASSTNSAANSVTPSTQAQSSPTAGPTSLPTASLSGPALPLKLPCVNCPYPQLTATLNGIEIDTPAQSTRWIFSLSNGGQYPCSRLSFDPIQLTDSRGTGYEGQGQGSSSNQFAIDTGQAVQETVLFNIIPAANTEYTLQVIIYLGGCDIPGSIGTPNTYQTENFTFV